MAWLESAAQRIPQQTLLQIPQDGIPLDALTDAVKDTGFEGVAQAAAWVFGETGSFFLDHCYDDGMYAGFADPWEDEIIKEGTQEWRKASALMDSVTRLADWLEEDLPGRFAGMLDFILARLTNQEQEQEETMMSVDSDTTRWSLPGPAEVLRDMLKVQLEVYDETILLRGFENDSAWVRIVSADEIANVFTQHLGFSSGLLPQEALWWNQGETGQVVALWRPPGAWSVALQREAFKPPARLRLHAGPGLRLLAGPGALGLRGAGLADLPPAAALPHPRLQRLQGREGLPRKPPVPRGGGTDTGVLLLDYRGHPRPLEEAPQQPARPMGGA